MAGFSLIELAVVMAILSTLFAVGIPAYTEFLQNTRIRGAAESIQSALQRTRVEAIKRNSLIEFSLGRNAHWSIRDLRTNSVLEEDSAAMSPIQVLPFSKTGSTSDPIAVVFTSLGTIERSLDGSAFLSRVDISTSALPPTKQRSLRVVIGFGGAVRMCELAVGDPTDSRHC